MTYCNLIFIDKGFNKKEFRTLENQDIMNKLNPIRLGFNNFGEMFFIEGKKIVKKEYFRFPFMKSFITFQPVPKFLRNLTSGRTNLLVEAKISHESTSKVLN